MYTLSTGEDAAVAYMYIDTNIIHVTAYTDLKCPGATQAEAEDHHTDR